MKPTKPGNHLIDPQRIRALGTGIGQSQQRSKTTGGMRAQKVADMMTPKVRSIAAPGYPPVDPMMADIRQDYPGLDAALPVNGDVPC
jgi:hypothetical protein